MLLIDGVKYEEWMPPNEDEFERVVKEHTQDIFGEQSIYFDRKQKLKSLTGIGSIPDGYVIILGDSPHWHIVEVELSSHPLHEHIVSQVSKFINGIKNPLTRGEIVGAIYAEITGNEFLKLKVKQAIGPVEIYKFLSDLISKPPVLTIIIEKDTQGLREAISTLAHPQIKVVEFQTFTREGIGLAVHAHLFEPLYKPVVRIEPPKVVPPREGVTKKIEINVTPAAIKYALIPLRQEYRHLFPGFKVPFALITDIGEKTPQVTGAPAGTPIGDQNAGSYAQGGLFPWYRKHTELKPRDKLVIEVIEPLKKYRLEILKK